MPHRACGFEGDGWYLIGDLGMACNVMVLLPGMPRTNCTQLGHQRQAAAVAKRLLAAPDYQDMKNSKVAWVTRLKL